MTTYIIKNKSKIYKEEAYQLTKALLLCKVLKANKEMGKVRFSKIKFAMSFVYKIRSSL